jgi:hypothetical protein
VILIDSFRNVGLRTRAEDLVSVERAHATATEAVTEKLNMRWHVIPQCPICEGKMECAYQKPTLQVCVCVDCSASLSVPQEAWEISRRKPRGKILNNP